MLDYDSMILQIRSESMVRAQLMFEHTQKEFRTQSNPLDTECILACFDKLSQDRLSVCEKLQFT